MEDLDKPREQPGAAEHIIQTLQAYGFEWDGEILFQSQRLTAYQDILQQLHPHCYPCTCSRKDVQQQGYMGSRGLVYAGTCRTHQWPFTGTRQYATRLRTFNEPIEFTDQIQGCHCQYLASELGDFVIKRADGIFAYQLAVVVDDAFQGINQIVRGADLLDNTPRQLYLQSLLGYASPSYAHVPLAVDKNGQKLSKQNLAPALPTNKILQNLVNALRFLGQDCPPAEAFTHLHECWDWAIAHWNLERVPKVMTRAYLV